MPNRAVGTVDVMDALTVLLDNRFIVPPVAPASQGVAWLRAHVVRFSEGEDHARRRRMVEALLARLDPDRLRRSGDHVATLAEALGLSRSVADDVRLVASCYQPHVEVTSAADAAVARLVDACSGCWDEETANRIGVLVQACDATAGLISGRTPPVATTRRVDPDGRDVVVDLAEVPFGAGRHACPGRDHAMALAEGGANAG